MEHFYGVVVVAFNTTSGPPSTGAAIAWAAQPANIMTRALGADGRVELRRMI